MEKTGESVNNALEKFHSFLEDLTDEEEETFGVALDEVYGSLEETPNQTE